MPRAVCRARSVILAEAEAALARCLDDDDFDLAGELLMAWPLTGASWSAAAAFGFRVLADVEDQTGHLPAPSTRADRLEKLSGDARTDYWIATAYHTIYVMGLLCAASLHPGHAPPRDIRVSRTGPTGAADALLQQLDGDDGRFPKWRTAFDKLPPAKQDALAGWLLTLALQRRVKQRDIGGVHALLDLGYRLGLAEQPAASQCAELLERLATFDRIASPTV